ncbi:sulfite exporter TauE/SafE family protein [Mycobacteroides chelonae]|uniref:Probable membrane transporter protein n=1 Tax=Mycobacteroides chelonae TaxID=1774 RepID=A0AB73U7Z5_MYCCH|nr:sulfite exporter TauE/SafE family protein [Mycobacteroides chelonae]
MDAPTLTLLLSAAAAAGWVDAVVGGGGLVLIPVLMLVFPGMTPATALGTNKLAALAGTSSAAVRLFPRTPLNWRALLGAFVLAAACSSAGAYTASRLPVSVFKPVVLVLLVAVGVFVATRPQFGTATEGTARTRATTVTALAVAAILIAFYDGIMGPGTGTFMIITLTAIAGMTFLESSATAKVLNSGTNVGALIVFASQGHVLWLLGLSLGVANIAGAQLGAHMALGRGAGFVRVVLLVVVVVMVGKLGYDMIG